MTHPVYVSILLACRFGHVGDWKTLLVAVLCARLVFVTTLPPSMFLQFVDTEHFLAFGSVPPLPLP